MKKFQKLIKDNYEDIIRAEDTLHYEFTHNDDFKISDGYLRNLYRASGAIEVIDEHYSFERLPFNIAVSFAELLITYATCMPDGYMTHKAVMDYFELAREIKDNVHWHRMRQPIFND